jgi:outer membrane immunogenic protein
MRKIATMAAVAALASAPHVAFAADLGGSMKDVPPPVMITNWTGFYAGVGIGFGAIVTDYNIHETDINHAGVQLYHNNVDRSSGGDGVLGTVQIGYDYQFPASRWLIGAYADYDWENFSSSHNHDEMRVGVPFHSNTKATLEDQWSVGGRVGLLSSPDTLLYALVGYTQAQVKGSASGDWFRDAHGDLWNGLSGTATLDGVAVGGGIETHLKDNWFLKLEYRFSQFGSDKAWEGKRNVMTDYTTPHVAVDNHIWGDVNADVHTARIALTYKFSRQGMVEPLK